MQENTEWFTSPDNKEAGIEGILIDEVEQVAVIKLSLSSLECEISLSTTLEPVLSLTGKICDKAALTDWVRRKGVDPWDDKLPMTEASIRISKIHEAIAFAWFKKNPDSFIVGDNFPSLFKRFVDKNDEQLMTSLLSAALRSQVSFDAVALLDLAYKSDKVQIFACVLANFVNTGREINPASMENRILSDISNGRLAWVQAILEIYHNFPAHFYGRLLHSAVTASKIDIVRYLSSLANVSQVSVDNMTPLYYACRENKNEIVEILLAQSTEHLDIGNTLSNDTPLCIATENANLALVKILMRAGASLNLPGKHNRTPFLVALAQAANDMVRYFISLDELDWLAKDVNGFNALNLVCQTHNATGLRLILQTIPRYAGEQLVDTTIGTDTLLGWSIKSSQACAEVLIEYGIGLFSLSSGQSPLQLAQAQKRNDLVTRMTEFYRNHPREIFQYLIHLSPSTTPIFKDWLNLKEAIYNAITPYIKTFSAENSADVEELAFIISQMQDENSPVQQFFKQKPTGFSGWFYSNPYPEQLTQLTLYLRDILSPENDAIEYDN